jgi:hypothetical protein
LFERFEAVVCLVCGFLNRAVLFRGILSVIRSG